MKRILSLFLALLMLFPLLLSCAEEEPAAEQVIAPDALPSTRSISALEEFHFAKEDSCYALRLKLPKSWVFQKSSGRYQIYTGGVLIGTLSPEETDNAALSAADEVDGAGVQTQTYTGLLTKNGETAAYYRLLFRFFAEGTQHCVTLELRQSEMDAVLYKQCTRPMLAQINGYDTVPVITLQDAHPSRKILLLGNSFLYPQFSNIGAILQEMIYEGEQGYTVETAAYGYASVERFATSTEAPYPAIRQRIANGEYAVVLLCGLYSAADLAAVQTILDLCQPPQTLLALLPAHNEGKIHILNAASQYRTVPLLNWQAEINALIDHGVDRTHFVVADAHSHSTALAGFVGAHLIYRALFRAVPPPLPEKCSCVDMESVTLLLEDYPTEGFRYIEEKQIRRFD